MSRQQSGKKIDTLEIKTATRVHSVELRFDRQTAKFLAYFGDTRFDADTPREIVERVTAEAKKLDAVKYSRWIEIRLEVSCDTGTGRRYLPDLDDRINEPGNTVSGFSLRFAAYDISPSWQEDGRPTYMRQDLAEDKDGNLTPDGTPDRRTIYYSGEDHSGEGHEGMVPWTPERWAALRETREALRRLAIGVYNLFGDVEKATAALDAVEDIRQQMIAGYSRPALMPSPGKKKAR